MSHDLDALLEAMGLKAVARAGWVRRQVPEPESVAAHSWGVSVLVLALLPPELDRARALTYAVLHDLPEVRVGDLTPHDDVDRAQKVADERDALADMTSGLSRGAALLETWERYEAQADPEARFVRQLDRLDMALQAVVYAEAGAVGMSEFVDSAARVVTHPALRPLLDACRVRVEQG
jgi:putative hydrolase of HD superfamily